jgi:O-antigen ligase
MPLSAAVSGEALTARSARLLKEVGYHRSNLSMMLAGGAWAMFAARVLARSRVQAVALAGCSVVLAFAQSLTAGRTGYVTWAGVGLVLCALRWRRYLLLMPVVALAIVTVVPGAADRLFQGFSPETRDTDRVEAEPALDFDEDHDAYTITSGRTLIWPFVLDKIAEAPVFGYGRLAMKRTGLSSFLWEELGESFPHPHSAYLEQLLDNGAVGLLVVLGLFAMLVWKSLSLLLDARSPVFLAAGGVAAAVVLAFLASSVGNHSFYPREGAVPMWCAIGLMLRVGVERTRVDAASRARLFLARRAGQRPAPAAEATDDKLWAA